MRSHGRFLLRRAPALASFLLAGGCSFPGTYGVSSDPAPQPSVVSRVAAAVHGTPQPGATTSIAPVTGPGPSPIMPLNLVGPESPQDQISLLQQNMKELLDNRNLVAARLAQVEADLRVREGQLGEAVEEVRKTVEADARLRSDNRRLEQENAELRKKLKVSDAKVQTLEEINKTLEKQAQPGGPPKEPEPGKSPD
jgi:hypothetical protein